MNRTIKYEQDAQKAIISGIDAVANAVKQTIGPKGRNVLIRNNLDMPIITNDGVTIAKSIQLKDNTEDAGAALIISAANKTNEVAGDGTTTTTILAQTMIHNYFENENLKDVNVVKIQKEMLDAADEISNKLKEMATPIKDNESIKRIATISSGREDTGELIAKAYEAAGEYGSVIVENSKTGKDNLVTIEGMKLSNGIISPYLFADRKNGKSELSNVSLLITKDKIDNVPDFFNVLDITSKTGKILLIMCEDIDFEPLQMILMNKAQGRLSNIGIIRLPGFGQLRDDLLEDIAIATGATIMGRDMGITLRDFNETMLGELEEAIITLDDTVLKFKEMNSINVNLKAYRDERVEEIKISLEKANDSEKEQYKRRIANLTNGISVIEIGGNSEVEINDKKLRIEDALNSVNAAREEGIVAGGGYSFLKIYMDAGKENRKGNQGEIIVYNSLDIITKQIAENAGYDGAMTVADCYNKKLGFNALTGEYEDLIKTGVINAVKVDRYSLLNATSLAASVITMGATIVDENQPESNVLQLQAPNIPTLL